MTFVYYIRHLILSYIINLLLSKKAGNESTTYINYTSLQPKIILSQISISYRFLVAKNYAANQISLAHQISKIIEVECIKNGIFVIFEIFCEKCERHLEILMRCLESIVHTL